MSPGGNFAVIERSVDYVSGSKVAVNGSLKPAGIFRLVAGLTRDVRGA
jgi:hypothetical protein